MVFDSIKTGLRIILFQATPSEIPRSPFVFFTVVAFFYICRVLVGLPHLSRLEVHHVEKLMITLSSGGFAGLIMSLITVILFFAVIYVGLLLQKHQDRFLQTATAVAACNIIYFVAIVIITIAYFIWGNIVSILTGNLSFNFSPKLIAIDITTVYHYMGPVLLLVIFPRIFSISFNTSFKKGILISLIIVGLTISLEGNLLRLLGA